MLPSSLTRFKDYAAVPDDIVAGVKLAMPPLCRRRDIQCLPDPRAVFIGAAAITGTGTAGANFIVGNAAANVISDLGGETTR